jgi:glutamate N-acetyltransferase/amino-acid N-acetyltransferase
VLAALGRSGADVVIDRTSVWLGPYCVFERGVPTAVSHDTIGQALAAPEVILEVDLGLGDAVATAWGCDLTEEYVRINASYTT